MILHEYEVTAVLRGKEGLREVTVTEYAYSASDVVYQAITNVAGQFHGEEFVRLTRIQPPQRLIDIASQELQEQILRVTKALNKA